MLGRIILGVLSISSSIAALSLVYFAVKEPKVVVDLLYAPEGTESRRKGTVWAILCLGGFGAMIYFSAKGMLGFIPDSVGSYNEYEEWRPLTSALASVIAFAGTMFLTDFLVKYAHRRYLENSKSSENVPVDKQSS